MFQGNYIHTIIYSAQLKDYQNKAKEMSYDELGQELYSYDKVQFNRWTRRIFKYEPADVKAYRNEFEKRRNIEIAEENIYKKEQETKLKNNN